jgi:hypothetical protein
MTDSTFNISFVVTKTGTMTLAWTSTDADVRPTFSLSNVSNPAVGDNLSLFFDSTEYAKTITPSHLYDLETPFSTDIPELLNDTYAVQAVYTPDGGSPVYSNTVNVTIDVPYTAPAFVSNPTISRAGNTFTCVPATDFTGRLIPTSTLQWRRDGVDISGQTSTTYTKVDADDDTDITCRQTLTNSEGSAGANSNTIVVPPDIWKQSASGIQLADKGFADNTHTFTGCDFVAGTGIIAVAKDITGALTGVSVTGIGSATKVVSDADEYASLWKITVATPGSYSVVVTRSGVHNIVGINTGTLVNVSATQTSTADLDFVVQAAPHSTAALTVPTNGVGICLFMGASTANVVWSTGAEEDDGNMTAAGSQQLAMSFASFTESATPTVTSHGFAGVAMAAATWGP